MQRELKEFYIDRWCRQWYVGKCLITTRQEKNKPWAVVFAILWSVNNPHMTDFKLQYDIADCRVGKRRVPSAVVSCSKRAPAYHDKATLGRIGFSGKDI